MKKKNKNFSIGIDLLGGDHNHLSDILQVINGLPKEVSAQFVIFVTDDMLLEIKEQKKTLLQTKRLTFLSVPEVISMDDDPLLAVRRKKQASIPHAIQMLQKKQLNAFVSTGNTGALITSAVMHLPLFERISRPALLTLLPTKKFPLAVIDIGANIHCNPTHLVQFANLGLAYQKSLGIKNPKIGLLNIGTEEKKGKTELYETYKLLQSLNSESHEIVFIGNVEGKQIFSGEIDVLVTDGFTGNVFLKTSEGISSFILEILLENQGVFSFSPQLRARLEKELYAAEYPGATLLGVDGIIVKCHGDAHPKALLKSVKKTLDLLQNDFLSKMKDNLRISLEKDPIFT